MSGKLLAVPAGTEQNMTRFLKVAYVTYQVSKAQVNTAKGLNKHQQTKQTLKKLLRYNKTNTIHTQVIILFRHQYVLQLQPIELNDKQ